MPLHNPLWEVVEPYLVHLGLYTVKDPTYGRWTLPSHPPHTTVIRDQKTRHYYRRVFFKPFEAFETKLEAYSTTAVLHAEDVRLDQEEIASGIPYGGRWVCYSVWEMSEPTSGWEGGGRGRDSDLVLVHGLSDYGLRYAPHIQHFLRAGFRVIIPDLPSYGRSSGINSYLPSLLMLPAALHAVLTDMVREDAARGQAQRKVFLSGGSMGGWTVLYYLLKYPPGSPEALLAHDTTEIAPLAKGQGQGYDQAEPPRETEQERVRVAGAFVFCPMVEVAKHSRPSVFTEYIGRGIVRFAGVLPLAAAARGNVSDDPRVEEDFFADPLCYHGRLRVGTGLSLLEGMLELDRRAEEINVPIRLVHGSADRVTSHLGTLRLFDRLPHPDKEIKIYDGYEHIMLKVGRDAEDDQKRQLVLQDWRDWLLDRC